MPDEPSDLPSSRWATEPDPDTSAVLDTRTLRALAHPVRVELVGLLRSYGPSTATRLAARLALNSGATSYHLRQLAAAGLVAEDERLGTGRDRWWRAVHRNVWLDTTRLDAGDKETTAVYLQAIAGSYAQRMQRAVAEVDSLPAVWQDAWDLSDYRLRLTPEELKKLLGDIGALINQCRRDLPDSDPDTDPGPPGAATVVLQLQAFAVSEPAEDEGGAP